MSPVPENVMTVTRVREFRHQMAQQRVVMLNRPIAEEIYEFLLERVQSQPELLALNMKFVGLNSTDGDSAVVSVSRRDINRSVLLLEDVCDKSEFGDPNSRRLAIAFELLDKQFVEAGGMKSMAFESTLGRIKAQVSKGHD